MRNTLLILAVLLLLTPLSVARDWQSLGRLFESDRESLAGQIADVAFMRSANRHNETHTGYTVSWARGLDTLIIPSARPDPRAVVPLWSYGFTGSLETIRQLFAEPAPRLTCVDEICRFVLPNHSIEAFDVFWRDKEKVTTSRAIIQGEIQTRNNHLIRVSLWAEEEDMHKPDTAYSFHRQEWVFADDGPWRPLNASVVLRRKGFRYQNVFTFRGFRYRQQELALGEKQ